MILKLQTGRQIFVNVFEKKGKFELQIEEPQRVYFKPQTQIYDKYPTWEDCLALIKSSFQSSEMESGKADILKALEDPYVSDFSFFPDSAGSLESCLKQPSYSNEIRYYQCAGKSARLQRQTSTYQPVLTVSAPSKPQPEKLSQPFATALFSSMGHDARARIISLAKKNRLDPVIFLCQKTQDQVAEILNPSEHDGSPKF